MGWTEEKTEGGEDSVTTVIPEPWNSPAGAVRSIRAASAMSTAMAALDTAEPAWSVGFRSSLWQEEAGSTLLFDSGWT